MLPSAQNQLKGNSALFERQPGLSLSLARVQIYDTSAVSSKLKLIASGEHVPTTPGNLTAWETHVTLKSHLHGFCSGGQISLRFELLRAQVCAR